LNVTAATTAERPESSERIDAEAIADQRKRDDAWKHCGLPTRHRDRVDAKPGPWADKLADLVAMEGSGFIVALLGNRGTGKTQMAAEMIRHRMRHADKYQCQYVRAMDVFLQLKASYGQDGPREIDVLNGFAKPHLLVIDEAHERGATDWEDRMLTYLIDKRYGAMKDTVLISNVGEGTERAIQEQFRTMIGESIYSRLIETGGVVTCGWESFRANTMKGETT